jgi:biotin-dependent carboxylase-like uncharacterized protein
VTPAATTLDVLDPGVLTTVQDAHGRPPAGRYGVAAGGALDVPAALTANALVRNPVDAAMLEITIGGLRIQFSVDAAIGFAGADLRARLGDTPVAPGTSLLARAGAELAFGEPRAGARAYLAVAGGFDVPVVLGSRSTDLRGGFGGFDGRALVAGDRVPVASPRDLGGRHSWQSAMPTATDPQAAVRILPGPHADRFAGDALERLCAGAWHVAAEADRMGYRLEGEPLRLAGEPELPSLGMPLGAVQVPGDGRPIVLLADRQPTGGYPVIGVVIRADIRLLAQRVPGDPVRFERTDVATAKAAWSSALHAAASVQPDDGSSLGWVG